MRSPPSSRPARPMPLAQPNDFSSTASTNRSRHRWSSRRRRSPTRRVLHTRAKASPLSSPSGRRNLTDAINRGHALASCCSPRPARPRGGQGRLHPHRRRGSHAARVRWLRRPHDRCASGASLLRRALVRAHHAGPARRRRPLERSQGIRRRRTSELRAGPARRFTGRFPWPPAELDRMAGRVPLNGLVRVRQHLDTDRGAALDLRASVGVFGSYGILAAVFAQATFASEKHFQSYYGVNESGYLMRILGIQGAYDLTPRWSLTSNLEHHHLGDNAARSPFVAQRGGVYFSAGASYRF